MALLLLALFSLPSRAEEQLLEAPLQTLHERALRGYESGDVDGGHQAMAELLAAIPGRIALTAELLGSMRRASVADRRMNSWTEYASERLVALHQAGLLEDDHAELPGAYDCLCVLRWDQGRLTEAWEALRQLKALDGENPYVRLGEARLLMQSESPAAIPLMESVLDAADVSREDSKIRELLMVVDRILTPSWSWEHVSILDPWRPIYSRAKFNDQTNRMLQEDLKAALARRRSAQQPQMPAGLSTQPVPDISSQEWADLAGQTPDKDATLFDRSIRMTAGADKAAPAADGLGLLDPWRAIDLRLQKMEAASLNALRQLQEAGYREQVRQRAPGKRTAREQLSWYRAAPWSQAANADLLALAQTDLNRGFAAAASRSFRDILIHSADPSTRRAAQVGIWLAAASEGPASGLDSLFEGVDPSARFPWMGGTETAANIRQRLRKGMPPEAGEGFRIAGLNPQILRLPAVPAWPSTISSPRHGAGLVDLQVHGDRILASARNWLAWYDVAAPATSLWCVVNAERAPSPDRDARLPGYWRPALGRGRLYTRAGDAMAPSVVRALDADDGRTIWETASPDPAAAPPRPAGEMNTVRGDPVIAGACVYYVEMAGRKGRRGDSELDLVCVAADDGSLLWRSTVVRADDDTSVGRQFRGGAGSVSIWETAPVIAEGAVYLNSAGIAARLDARDGRLEWACPCRGSLVPVQMRPEVAGPLGAAPLVAGERVLLMPRNGGALFAVDSQTGKRLWEQVLAQPVELLGARKDSAVVRTMSELMAVSLGTGAIRWHVPAPADIVGRCALRGETICLASEEALLCLGADDGTLRERYAWPKDATVWNYAIAGKSLVMVTDETAPAPNYSPGRILTAEAPADAGTLRLPLKPGWFLPREHARVFAAPPRSPLQGRIFVSDDGMIEAVDVGPRGRSVWRRFTAGTVSRIFFDKSLLVLCSGVNAREPGVQVTTAIDGFTGRTLWHLPVFQNATDATLTDGVLLMRSNATDVRAYDVASGRQLWARQGFFSTLARRPDFMSFVEGGQLHLFGHQWQNGIPHLRVNLRTGAMLPLQWAVEGTNVLLGSKSQIGMGKKEAFIRVVDRSGGGAGKSRVYRYSLADGKARELQGMDAVLMANPPYVLVGRDGGAVRTLFSGDDDAYQYPLDRQGGIEFSDGFMVFSGNNRIAVVEPASKRLVVELDVGKKQFGGPGVVRLDDDRFLLYGTDEKTLEFKEVDVKSGRIVREASLPRFDPAGREQLRGRPLAVNGVLLLCNDYGVQVLFSEGE